MRSHNLDWKSIPSTVHWTWSSSDRLLQQNRPTRDIDPEKHGIYRDRRADWEVGMPKMLELDDMDQAAVVQRRSRDHALPWIKVLHTPEEDRWFFRERVFKTCQLWGYFEGGQLAGFIAFRVGWIDHLYVLPTSQHRGIGSALLQVAQSKMRNLNLWTFQRNAMARRFYEKHGFTLIKETDGAGNEEKEPDALYTWRSAI